MPGDLVERRAADRLVALGAMRADREAVRLVAQPLQEIEHRVARFERERPAARAERTARARHCGRAPWRSPTIGTIVDAEFGEDLLRRRQLALAAVDQHQIGPHARARAPDPPSARGRSGGATPRASSRNRRRRRLAGSLPPTADLGPPSRSAARGVPGSLPARGRAGSRTAR